MLTSTSGPGAFTSMASTVMSDSKLVRLLQLASPALPVGGFSYSQGLEAAIEAGIVRDAATARAWIGDVLRFSLERMEAPLFLRLCDASRGNDAAAARRWNELFLASRESAELRAETVQMGYSLARLLPELGIRAPEFDEPSFPAAFACAVAAWNIDPQQALIAYLWSWAENQVLAALKAVPLGQTHGQQMLLELGGEIERAAAAASSLANEELGNYAPGLALLSARHETQYTRLFRS
jgi:urease accessory protein